MFLIFEIIDLFEGDCVWIFMVFEELLKFGLMLEFFGGSVIVV